MRAVPFLLLFAVPVAAFAQGGPQGVVPATQSVSGTLTTNADTAATGLSLAATLNTAITVPTPGRATFAWTYNGLTASGATLTPEASDDSGVTWSTVNCVQPVTGALVTAIATDGQCRINAAARTTMRLRVSTAGTGTVTVAWNASSETGLVAMSAPITAAPVIPRDLDVATVTTGGTAVTALAAGNAAKGGFIKAVSAILCIRDSTGTAGTVDGVAGTTCIAVGQTYMLPPQVGAISVNSSTAGAIIGGRGYK